MEKVALFADVQNIYYTTKEKYNCHFNYKAFWELATAGKKVVQAIAYATDRDDDQQKNFQRILRTIGFQVKLIPFIQRSDGSAKGDWDVGLALDLVEYAVMADRIILVSGDGDYTAAVRKAIDAHRVQLDVYGVPGLTALALKNAASRYIPIEGELLLAIPETW